MNLSDELVRFGKYAGPARDNTSIEMLLKYLNPKSDRSIGLRELSSRARSDPTVGRFTQSEMMRMINRSIPGLVEPSMCEPARQFLKELLAGLVEHGATVSKKLGVGGIVENLDEATSADAPHIRLQCEKLVADMQWVRGMGPFEHICPAVMAMLEWRLFAIQARQDGIQWRVLMGLARRHLETLGNGLSGLVGGYAVVAKGIFSAEGGVRRRHRPTPNHALERTARLCGMKAALLTVGPYADSDPIDSTLIHAVGYINQQPYECDGGLFVEVESRLEKRMGVLYAQLGLEAYLAEHHIDRYADVVATRTFPPLSVVERFLWDPYMGLRYAIDPDQVERRRATIPCRLEELHLLQE